MTGQIDTQAAGEFDLAGWDAEETKFHALTAYLIGGRDWYIETICSIVSAALRAGQTQNAMDWARTLSWVEQFDKSQQEILH
jgi:hypothetical protein